MTTIITLIPNACAIIESGESITVIDNGVKTSFADTVAICRCGKSRMFPFCDGSHKNDKEVVDDF